VGILRRIAAKFFYLFLLAIQFGVQLYVSLTIQLRFTFGLINNILFYENPQEFNVKLLLVQLFILKMIIYLYCPSIIHITIYMNLLFKLTIQYYTFALMQVVTEIWNIYNQYLRVHSISSQYSNKYCIGGGKSKMFSHSELFSATQTTSISLSSQFELSQFEFVAYVLQKDSQDLAFSSNMLLLSNCPLAILTPKLTIADLKVIAASHSVFVYSKMSHDQHVSAILNHKCNDCPDFTTVFKIITSEDNNNRIKLTHANKMQKYKVRNAEKYAKNNLNAVNKYNANNPEKHQQDNLAAVQKFNIMNPEKHQQSHLAAVQRYQVNYPEKHQQGNLAAVQRYQVNYPEKHQQSNLAAVQRYQVNNPEKHQQSNLAAMQQFNQNVKFPPKPPTERLQHSIISDFCTETSPNAFIESGCAVCGKLTKAKELIELSTLDLNLDVLKASGVTADNIENEVILIDELDSICLKCHKSISKEKRPQLSLANGLWIGKVPEELSNLSYAEQLLIARVRHNRCIVRVSSGMHKMQANAITFSNPTPKIYNILPPSVDELDEVLAFIYWSLQTYNV